MHVWTIINKELLAEHFLILIEFNITKYSIPLLVTIRKSMHAKFGIFLKYIIQLHICLLTII